MLNTVGAPSAPAQPGVRRAGVRRRGPRSLHHPAFRQVWLSSLAVYPARFIDITVLAWLVVVRTDDPLAVALLGFFRFAPFLFAGPLMGWVADRFPRIRIMQASQLGQGAGAAVMAVLLFTGHIELWHIYAYTAATGIFWIVDVPARRAYMSAVVGARNITAALALDMLAFMLGQIVGANLAGGLLTRMPSGWFYVLLVALAAISLWLLRDLPVLWRRELASEREPLLTSLSGGFRFVRRNRMLLGGLLVIGSTNLFGFTYEPMVPIFATAVLGAGPGLLGLLMSAAAFGSLAAGIGLAAIGPRLRRHGLAVIISATALHLAGIAFSFSTWYAASFIILVITGIFGMLFGIMHSNLFLVATPERMRGRVLGLQMFVIGTFPLSSLAVGALANVIGPGPAVRSMAAAGLLVLAVVFVAFPEMRLETRRPERRAPMKLDLPSPASNPAAVEGPAHSTRLAQSGGRS